MRDLERRVARLERKILANQGSMCVVELLSCSALMLGGPLMMGGSGTSGSE